MKEYLAFVDEIGRTIDGYYTYKFDFTYDKEIVWGDFFNICPCSIVPNLIPDINTLSHTINIDLPSQLELAKNNMCFSMQDCIDGIIPMAFTDINDPDHVIFFEKKPLIFNFGDNMEELLEKCKKMGFRLSELMEVIKNNDGTLDNIIDNINNGTDFDDEYDF